MHLYKNNTSGWQGIMNVCKYSIPSRCVYSVRPWWDVTMRPEARFPVFHPLFPLWQLLYHGSDRWVNITATSVDIRILTTLNEVRFHHLMTVWTVKTTDQNRKKYQPVGRWICPQTAGRHNLLFLKKWQPQSFKLTANQRRNFPAAGNHWKTSHTNPAVED